MMNSLAKTALLVLVFCTGCVPFWKREKPVSTLPLPSSVQQSWCYKTLAQIDCYTTPQNFPADRLVSVQPYAKIPLTEAAHKKSVRESLEPQK